MKVSVIWSATFEVPMSILSASGAVIYALVSPADVIALPTATLTSEATLALIEAPR